MPIQKKHLSSLFATYCLLIPFHNSLYGMDKQTPAILELLNQNQFEKQVSNLLLQPHGQTKKVIAAAFSMQEDGHIGVAFDDNTVEVRNARNTNNLIHSVEFHNPVDYLAFCPWINKKYLLMQERSATRSNLRILDIYNKQNIKIDALNSSEIPCELLDAEIKNIVFNSNVAQLKTFDRQNGFTPFIQLASSTEWIRCPSTVIPDLHGFNYLLSPLINYQATINPRNPYQATISPATEDGNLIKEKEFTITLKQPIDELVFSMNGQVIGILTQLSSQNPLTPRVSLWNSSTGEWITDLDIPNQKDIKSLQLNGDGSEVIVLYSNETPAMHITFDNPSAHQLKEKVKNDALFKAMLVKALEHKQAHATSYFLSWKESGIWKTLSGSERAHLNKAFAIKNTWTNFIGRLIINTKTLTAFCLYVIYCWWKASHAQ
jgi:hypothetical protein